MAVKSEGIGKKKLTEKEQQLLNQMNKKGIQEKKPKNTGKKIATAAAAAILAAATLTIPAVIYYTKTQGIRVVVETVAEGLQLQQQSMKLKKGATIGDIKVPNRPGYFFAGFYADESLTQPLTLDTKITKDTTIYLYYILINYVFDVNPTYAEHLTFYRVHGNQLGEELNIQEKLHHGDRFAVVADVHDDYHVKNFSITGANIVGQTEEGYNIYEIDADNKTADDKHIVVDYEEEINSYHITFYKNSEVGDLALLEGYDQYAQHAIQHGEFVGSIPSPSKESTDAQQFTFKHWLLVDKDNNPILNETGEEQYIEFNDHKMVGDLYVRAVFEGSAREYKFTISEEDLERVQILLEDNSDVTTNTTIKYGQKITRIVITPSVGKHCTLLKINGTDFLPNLVDGTATIEYVVTGDTTIEYDEEINTYTVNFYGEKNQMGKGKFLESKQVQHGGSVSKEGPEKEDKTFIYTFNGWQTDEGGIANLEKVELKKDGDQLDVYASYTAVYREYELQIPDHVTVTYLSGTSHNGAEDHNHEAHTALNHTYTGETIKLHIGDRVKIEYTASVGSTGSFTVNGMVFESGKEYTISGDTELGYSEEINQYTVNFLNEDGTTIQSVQVKYGGTASFSGEVPTKESTETFKYTHIGWSENLENITHDMDVYPTFKATYIEYEIVIPNNVTLVYKNGTSHTDSDDHDYIHTVDIDGHYTNKVSLHFGDTIQLTYEASEGRHKTSFTFNGADVGEQTFNVGLTNEIKYTEAINEYTVEFYDEKLSDAEPRKLKSVTVQWGNKADFGEKDPTKDPDKIYTYTFMRWQTESGDDATKLLSEVKQGAHNSTLKVYASFSKQYINYNITIPEHVKVTYISGTSYDGERTLQTNATLHYGDKIRIEYTPTTGYHENGSVVTNAILQGGEYEVQGAVSIDYKEESDIYKIADIPDYVTITLEELGDISNKEHSELQQGSQLSKDSVLHYGDKIKLTYAHTGYTLNSFTIDRQQLQDGTYLVTSNITKIVVDEHVNTYTLTFDKNIHVRKGSAQGQEITSNSKIEYTDILYVSFDLPTGHKNGKITPTGLQLEGEYYKIIEEQDCAAISLKYEDELMEFALAEIPAEIVIKKDSKPLQAGDKVKYDELLEITINTPDGHQNGKIQVVGLTRQEDGKYKVTAVSEDTQIKVTYTDQLIEYDLEIQVKTLGSGSVTVTRNGQPISGEDKLHIGDRLEVTPSINHGYHQNSLTINGESKTEYTVGTTNVTIVLDASANTYNITLPKFVTIHVGSEGGESTTTLTFGETYYIKVAELEAGHHVSKELDVDTNFFTQTDGVYVLNGQAVELEQNNATINPIEYETEINTYTLNIPEGVTVHKDSVDGATVGADEQITYGSKLYITYAVKPGYHITQNLQVSQDYFKQTDDYYTLDGEKTGSATHKSQINGITYQTDINTYKLSIPENVIVKLNDANGQEIFNGGDVTYGATYYITTKEVPTGYHVKDALQVSETYFTSNGSDKYTLDKEAAGQLSDKQNIEGAITYSIAINTYTLTYDDTIITVRSESESGNKINSGSTLQYNQVVYVTWEEQAGKQNPQITANGLELSSGEANKTGCAFKVNATEDNGQISISYKDEYIPYTLTINDNETQAVRVYFVSGTSDHKPEDELTAEDTLHYDDQIKIQYTETEGHHMQRFTINGGMQIDQNPYTMTVHDNVTINYSEEINTYTVTFYDYKGERITSVDVQHGKTASFNQADPTKPSTNMFDYTFAGWSTQQNGDDLVNLQSTKIEDENTYAKLYAQFKQEYHEYSITIPQYVTLTYVSGTSGETVAEDTHHKAHTAHDEKVYTNTTVKLHYEDKLTLTTQPPEGWKVTELKVGGVDVDYDGSYTFTVGATPEENSIIYNQDKKTYVVNFYNGKVIYDTVNVKHGDTAALSDGKLDPVHAEDSTYNYTFVGWGKSENAKQADEGILNNVTGPLNVYAVYSEAYKEYNLSYSKTNVTVTTIDSTILSETTKGDYPTAHKPHQLDENKLHYGDIIQIVAEASTGCHQTKLEVSGAERTNVDNQYKVTGDVVINYEEEYNTITVSGIPNYVTITYIQGTTPGYVPQQKLTPAETLTLRYNDQIKIAYNDADEELEYFKINDEDRSGELDGQNAITITLTKEIYSIEVEEATYLMFEHVVGGWRVNGIKANKIAEISKLEIPPTYKHEDVIEIKEDAFKGNTTISSVDIGTNIQTIGANAFSGCKITTITIPASVQTINSKAFDGCTGLTDVTILSSQVFKNATGLDTVGGLIANATTITVPKAIVDAEENIYIENMANYIKSEQDGNCTFRKTDATVLAYTYLPESQSWRVDGFKSASQNKLEIPADYMGFNVIEIKADAFKDDTTITTITLGNNLVTIGANAFEGCTGITQLALPASVQTIGDRAFYGINISEITIPENVQTIGTESFAGLNSLTHITFNATNCLDVYKGTLGDVMLNNYKSPFDQSGEAGIDVTLGNLVTKVPAGLFYGVNVTDIQFGSLVSEIGALAFAQTGLTELDIPSSVTKIGAMAFTTCQNLASVTIPENVENIGAMAFAMCIGLENINFNATNMQDCVDPSTADTDSYDTSYWIFAGTGSNAQGMTVTFGENVTKVPAHLFDCYDGADAEDWSVQCAKVVIGKDVATIGEGAFKLCTIKNLDLSSAAALKTIGANAFESSGLTEITVPAGVNAIGKSAFEGCALEKVTILGADVYTAANGIAATNAGGILQNANTVIVPQTIVNANDNTYLEESGEYIRYSNDTNYEFKKAQNTYLKYTYLSDSNSLMVSGFKTGADQAIVEIPSEYANLQVTAVAEDAFRGNNTITSLTIGENVQKLGAYAFSGLRKLTQVNFNATNCADTYRLLAPNSVDGNPEQDNVFTESGTSGINVTFGSQVTKVPAGLFIGVKVANIQFGSQVSEIGICAFAQTNITELTLPASVTKIGKMAFMACQNLASVTIPENVEFIGLMAFFSCDKLTNINFNAINMQDCIDNLLSADGMDLTTVSGMIFSSLSEPEGFTVTFGDKVSKIPANLFNIGNSRPNVKSVILGKNVKTIGEGAFAGNTTLTSVDFAKATTLTTIGKSAFVGCAGLDQLALPASVTTIGEESFYGCNLITEVTIPAGVNTIGVLAFAECTSLNKVTILGADVYKLANAQNSAGGLLAYANTVVVPKTIVDNTANTNSYLADTNLFVKVPVDNNYEFRKDTASILKYTYLPSSNSYQVDGFKTGKTAATLEILDTYQGLPVKQIASKAFLSNTDITKVVIGANVYSLGNNTFQECTNLQTVEFAETNNIHGIGGGTFSNCTKLKTIDLSKLTKIQAFASNVFQNCSSLTEITIPASVTAIQTNAFSGCTGLTKINYNATNCNNLTLNTPAFTNAGSSAGLTVEFGDTATNIPAYLFANVKNLKNIILSKNVASVGTGAFGGTGLASVKYLGTLEDWCQTVTYHQNVTPNSSSNAISLYMGDTKIENTLTIPATVTKINQLAFRAVVDITRVVIGAKVDTIGMGAFSGATIQSLDCTNATALKTIDQGAFSSCSQLETVDLTGAINLVTIGSTAFSGCTNLTKLMLPNGLASEKLTIQSYAFASCTSLEEFGFGADMATKSTSDDNVFKGSSMPTIFRFYGTADEWASGAGGMGYALALATGAFEAAAGASESYTYTLYLQNTLAKNITISTPTVAMGAFVFCSSITDVTFNSGVLVVGESAFNGCANLQTIQLSTTIQTIEAAAFGGTALTELTIPANVQSIGDCAFDCDNLAKVTILSPAIYQAATSINTSEGAGGILNNAELIIVPKTIVLAYTNEYLNNTDLYLRRPVGNNYEFRRLTATDLSYTYSEKDDAWTVNGFKTGKFNANLVIPDTYCDVPVTAIAAGAFSTLDEGKEQCAQITSLSIGKNITEIGEAAFAGIGITELTIPENVTSLGVGAFGLCPNLSHIYYNAIEAATPYEMGDLSTDDENIGVFVGSGSQTESLVVEIGDNVTTIGNGLFYTSNYVVEQFEGLYAPARVTELRIGKNVKYIGVAAFANLPYLQRIEYNAINVDMSVIMQVLEEQFSSNTQLALVFKYSWFAKSGSAITTVPSGDLSTMQPEDIAIEGGIELVFGDDVQKVPEVLFMGGTAGHTLSSYSDLLGYITKITIGKNVTEIGEGAFWYNFISKLDMSHAEKLQTIGPLAFAYSVLQGEIVIPKTVTTIEDGAFGAGSGVNPAYTGVTILSGEVYKALKTDMDVENDVGGLLNCQAIQTITVPKSFVEDYGNNYITNNYTIARDDVVVDGVQCYQFAKNGQRA